MIGVVNVDNSVDKMLIRRNQGINENNLMVLPIFSLKKKRIYTMTRKWKRDNVEVGIQVVGGARYGVPTIYALDTLMALFRLLVANMDMSIDTNNIPKQIHFTYNKLAKEMGLTWSIKTKRRLEGYIRCLVETTIYSDFGIRDKELGKYVYDFNGEESCRILDNYRSYSISKRKKANEELLAPTKVEEYQSVEIGTFFYNNLIHGYYKLYNYDKYKLLTKAISKRLFLILSTWSHGAEKYLNMQTIYDYVGLEVTTDKERYYYNRLLKESLEELKSIKFIQGYIIDKRGVTFIFDNSLLDHKYNRSKYNNDYEVIARLREIDIDYETINLYYSSNTKDYIIPLLRYIDYCESKGKIIDIKSFTLRGLPYGSYEVNKFR